MTAAVIGVEALPVTVEVDVGAGGLPGMTVVGLPDATVRESRDRVRTAIRNAGFPFPGSRVTVSLAPSDMRKVGAAFDLPIALGILAAAGVLPHRDAQRVVAVGGVSLDGSVPAMRGLLPIAAAARRANAVLIFPDINLPEAAIVDGLPLCPVGSLMDAARAFVDPARVSIQPGRAEAPDGPLLADDLSEVRGQALGRRALEIAAAGGHHLLLNGPPGAGKTMLARRLPGLLPTLCFEEALAVTTIHSVAGALPPGGGLITQRPFRSPHHTCSEVALVGGGSVPRPGELSLAHHGVLFLDELPEFSRRSLDTLRQPLEEGVVHIARAARSVAFPAQVMLVAAMNPCPCGFSGSSTRACICTAAEAEHYRRRPSGPLLDRFDLRLDLPPVPWRDITDEGAPPESTGAVRGRVLAARRRQTARQDCLNSRLEGAQLRRWCQPTDAEGLALLGKAVDRHGLSVRGVSRVLRVARTIADLGGAPRVSGADLAEALHFRAAEPGTKAWPGFEIG